MAFATGGAERGAPRPGFGGRRRESGAGGARPRQFYIRPPPGDASVAVRLNKLDSPGSARRGPRLRYKYHSVHALIQELCAPGVRSALDSPLP